MDITTSCGAYSRYSVSDIMAYIVCVKDCGEVYLNTQTIIVPRDVLTFSFTRHKSGGVLELVQWPTRLFSV